jgi:hypothetical protein
MRRPFNWVVVCLSLLLLTSNLTSDWKPAMAGQTTHLALAESQFAEGFPLERSEPQFGYVRTDGSFQPLTKQAAAPDVADVGPAVFVWSSPVSASKIPASF